MPHRPSSSLFERSLGFVPLIAFLGFALFEIANTARGQTAFSGAESPAAVAPAEVPPGGRLLTLRVGEIVEVHHTETRLFGAGKETAFYVPVEGRGLVSLAVEKARGHRIYTIKALAPGETLGGVVPRSTLDRGGLDPKNDAAHARIQLALKAAPVLFVVLSVEPAR